MNQSSPRAAIDIGTHSSRLLIGTVASGRVEEILRRTTVTKLGRGVDSRRRLDPESLRDTLAVLGEYKSLCDAHGVKAGRAVATSALREAEDRNVFLDRAHGVLGYRPEVITGDEEARLTFIGASASLPDALRGKRVALIDIGGGSTEIGLGAGADVADRRSLPLGCLRLSERFMPSESPSTGEIAATQAFCRQQLAELKGRAEEGYAAVGVAGTVTSLLAIRDRIDPYEPGRIHHGILTVDDVRTLLADLAAMSLEARRGVAGLSPDRADVIVAGAAILAAIMEEIGFDQLVVSEADILDGILLDARGE